MALFKAGERERAELLSRLIKTNPFLPEWVQLERNLLGDMFSRAAPAYHHAPLDAEQEVYPNIVRTTEIVERLTEATRGRLSQGEKATKEEKELYRDLALFRIYRLNRSNWSEMALAANKGETPTARDAWRKYQRDFDHFFGMAPETDYFGPFLMPDRYGKTHGPRETFFALFFQIVRAFDNIFRSIIGGSQPTTRLRAAVWQSLFTHDIQRYYYWLHHRMYEIPTLICGPSGTGKELVARAVGRSQFIPFDPVNVTFRANFNNLFLPVNLSALAPGLIESELFGHVKGAFSGATSDRKGRLTQCSRYGAVFLDEMGETSPEIQVKLLRVLQSRDFEAVGSTKRLKFRGKLVAATNRDLITEMQAGNFRGDLFFRLCADQIVTPSLSEQLQDQPTDLGNLVLHNVRQVLGNKADRVSPEALQLAAETTDWIQATIRPEYHWPGNFRELGHCVRSFILRREYRPLDMIPATSPVKELARAVEMGSLSADELQQRYFHHVYLRAGSYQEAGRRLGVNWRTVRTKIAAHLNKG